MFVDDHDEARTSLVRGPQVCTEQGRTGEKVASSTQGIQNRRWQNVCGLVTRTEMKGLEKQENVRAMCAV